MNYLDKLRRFEHPEHRLPDFSGGALARLQRNREDVTIEPASTNACPVYWERADGRIYGPALPEFLALVGLGLKSTDLWVVAIWDGCSIWIRSDRLRSRQAFESQQGETCCTLRR